MKKRAFSNEERTALWKPNIIAIVFIMALVAVVIMAAACWLTLKIFHGVHESQHESCEKEALKRLEEIISFVDSKQSEDSLVRYSIPSITVKSAPDSEIGVIAEYRNGKIVITRELTTVEYFVIICMAPISIAIWALPIICIWRIRKKRALVSDKEGGQNHEKTETQ